METTVTHEMGHYLGSITRASPMEPFTIRSTTPGVYGGFNDFARSDHQ